jgi:hypothetical protein
MLRWSSAGHLPPLLLCTDDDIAILALRCDKNRG